MPGSVLEQLRPRSMTPYFCCLKEQGSGFPLIVTAYPNSEAFMSPLGSALFSHTYSISFLSMAGLDCPRPPLPSGLQGSGSKEEPWTGAQEAIPSQFCDINQNYVT